MTRKAIVLAAAIAAISCASAKADETGLASIHDQGPAKGRRICMTNHYHDGSGQGSTRKEAEAKAIRAWIDFTAWEYGSTWGSFQTADARTMNCNQAGAGWSCNTSARPCKQDTRSIRGRTRSAER
jgi:hypothetical protein